MERIALLLSQSSIERAANGLQVFALLLLGALALFLFFGSWLLVQGVRQKKRRSVIFGVILLSLPVLYGLASTFIAGSAREKALEAEMRARTPGR